MNNRLGIMQPYLFPYIGYFQLIKAVDSFVIYDDVQYITRGWINRNNILINNQKKMITLPVKKASPNKRINEMQILGGFDKFLKTLDLAYKKAPYHTQAMELIADLCFYEDKNLARFIGNSLESIALYLGVETNFLYASSIKGHRMHHGQEKIIAICNALAADTYINPVGGRELYSKHDFQQSHIKLKFLEASIIPYSQFGSGFIGGLSIIDTIMFNSPEEVKKMLDEYILI